MRWFPGLSVFMCALRGGRERRPFLLGLLVPFLLAPGPAWAADGDAAASLWPVWGAATLQLACMILAGLILAFHRRARDLDGDRVTDLQRRVDQLQAQVAHTREGYIPRSEADQRFSRLHDSVKSLRDEVRVELGALRAELKTVQTELKTVQTDVSSILSLLSSPRE